MALTITYYVKREPGLFRKGRWAILMDKLKIAERDSELEALELASVEAQRSADLGRTVEVWANNGEGFVLYKALKPTKKKADDDGDEEGPGEEARDGDDDTTLGAAVF